MARGKNDKDKDQAVNIPIEDAAEEQSEQAAPEAEAKESILEEAEKVVEEAAATVEADADAVMAKAAEELKKAQAEVQEYKDKYLRLHAEWDTYRRRTNEQRAEEKVRANEKLVTDLLPVLDDFERTVKYAVENGEAGLLDGVKAVQTKLNNTLEKAGMEAINPAGEAFNALEHQAVATVENADVPDETVDQVYQLGYKMGNKVLRPAMVTVTSGGPKREVPQETEEE